MDISNNVITNPNAFYSTDGAIYSGIDIGANGGLNNITENIVRTSLGVGTYKSGIKNASPAR